MTFVKGQRAWNKDIPNTWYNPIGLELGRGWNKGKTFTTDKRIARAWLGKKRDQETKNKISNSKQGSISWNKGLKGYNAGEKSHFWKGWITSKNEQLRKSLEAKLWREAVFKRDGYICVLCGDNKGGNLEADHIKPWSLYSELRFAIDNGRTLCHECHQKTDTYGGRVNNYA